MKNPKSNLLDGNLKPEHANFVHEYVANGGNGTQAYRSAYLKAKETTAATESYRLLRIPKIRSAIQSEFARQFKERDKEFSKGITFNLIRDICHANIFDIIDIEGDTMRIKDPKSLPLNIQRLVKSVKVIEKETEQGRQVTHEVTLKDSMKALELCAKIQRMISDEAPDIEFIVIPARRDLASPRPGMNIQPEFTVEKENNSLAEISHDGDTETNSN